MSQEPAPSEASPGIDASAASDAAVIAQTRTWIERAVIGLNLCPFARAPFTRDRVRLVVSHARDTETLLVDLRKELTFLHQTDPLACETTLLIHPQVLGDFLDFNDFLDDAEEALREADLEGELQIASFHPDYQFADTAADAPENRTNRSPWPTLHLLRESSIDAAVESGIDTDAIYERNIETLRKLGDAGWDALRRDDPTG